MGCREGGGRWGKGGGGEEFLVGGGWGGAVSLRWCGAMEGVGARKVEWGRGDDGGEDVP